MRFLFSPGEISRPDPGELVTGELLRKRAWVKEKEETERQRTWALSCDLIVATGKVKACNQGVKMLEIFTVKKLEDVIVKNSILI